MLQSDNILRINQYEGDIAPENNHFFWDPTSLDEHQQPIPNKKVSVPPKIDCKKSAPVYWITEFIENLTASGKTKVTKLFE